MAEAKLDVRLVTPEREVWRGEADLVVATAADGQLGVMPGHAPLLALLAIGRLEIVNGSDRRRAAVDGGFLHVFADRVDVLAEHADLESDIDLAREEDRRARAEQRLEREKSEDARAELAKAVTRIDLRSSRS